LLNYGRDVFHNVISRPMSRLLIDVYPERAGFDANG